MVRWQRRRQRDHFSEMFHVKHSRRLVREEIAKFA